jgi:uncharacterized 2Fe-2S/4Fe-4S cluster protein (DUF4445 family)
MPTIQFRTAGLSATVEVPEGISLLEASRRSGLAVEAPCNGMGTCGKCRVRIDAPAHVRHPPGAAGPRDVLACQAEVAGDLLVEIPRTSLTGLRILAEGLPSRVPVEPRIRKLFRPETGRTEVFAGSGLLDSEPGDTTGESFGLVVDIGTTTLVASLVDLASGQERLSRSALNPQTRHGQDVLTRIQMGSTAAGLERLQGDLMAELNRLTGSLCTGSGVAPGRIHEAVFSGNTVMLHLAAGADPRSLGRFPYTPVLTGHQYLEARDLGLGIAPRGLVYLPPVLSAYVGADIVSGLLATELHRRPGVVLFVDIGTNGEMVLSMEGRLTATSTAAGPAFEGMNIACGMRASAGAVERFAVDGADILVETIGAGEPVGLCGSGLLDLVGELARHGSLDRNGRFARAGQHPHPGLGRRLESRDGRTAFQVAGPVFLTQKDVRQVQLAKGAVRAGIELLLGSQGLVPAQVDQVLIAGSFGYHLRTSTLVNLGLVPEAFADRVTFVGNTSQSGGRAFLVNARSRDDMAALASRVRVLELANDPAFEKTFVAAMAFPAPSGPLEGFPKYSGKK